MTTYSFHPKKIFIILGVILFILVLPIGLINITSGYFYKEGCDGYVTYGIYNRETLTLASGEVIQMPIGCIPEAIYRNENYLIEDILLALNKLDFNK